MQPVGVITDDNQRTVEMSIEQKSPHEKKKQESEGPDGGMRLTLYYYFIIIFIRCNLLNLIIDHLNAEVYR